MTISIADATHVEECPRNFEWCQKDEESFLVMNMPYTGILNRRLCYVLSKHNPHYCEKVKQHPSYVMQSEAMNNEHLFGPYFFD